MTGNRIVRNGAAALCVVAMGFAGNALTAAPSPQYYQIVLEEALYQGSDTNNLREIVLDLEKTGDVWGPIYGLARNYNMGCHHGAVTEATEADGMLSLRMGLTITPDKWVAGGESEYTVELTPRPDGSLEGTFAGTFNGAKVGGRASGTRYAPVAASDHVPLAPQEHPRLLLRKSDLKALRKKAATLFGKAAVERMEKMGTPACLGFLYQLTGKREWAEKAEREAVEYLEGRKPEGSAFVSMMANWGRLEQLALVYDLCYDALSPEFKTRYRAWIGNFAYQVYFAPENMGRGVNWIPVSNHSANVYSGLTLSALTLFDEPAPEPAPPVAPFLDEELPPAENFTPAEGVPVVALTPGVSPTEWLQTEPLRAVTPDDPREVFYGLETVDARPGTKVKVGEHELTFMTMPPENRSTADYGGLHVGHFLQADASAKLKEPLTMAVYTVIRVDEPGEYVFHCPVSRSNLAQGSLAGRLLEDGQVVRLRPGLYPLMTLVQWRMKWGSITPSLSGVKPEQAEAWKKRAAQLRSLHEARLRKYDAELAEWRRTGGDPAFARLLRLSRFTSTIHCVEAVGRGGFQGESGHYSNDACYGHAQLWPVYRRVMGYDLTPDGEYVDYLPRKVIGGPQDITGTTSIDSHIFPALFPVIRPEWQPEMLTVWLQQEKVADPALPVEVLRVDPVRAFINFPLDMAAAPVGTKLPLSWKAPVLGYYCLRSGWDDKSFVAQVFVKNRILAGWSGENAGTFRLRGLGSEWACGPTDRARTREQENVVWFPELELDDGARGRLTDLSFGDGTLTLSLNLDEVYEARGRYSTSKMGNVRALVRPGWDINKKERTVPPASGIHGMRSLAFDFTGISGAPCLFAVVDRIEGAEGAQGIWLFQPPADPPKTKRGKDAEPLLQADEHGFRIAPLGAEATMAGRFVCPDPVEIDTRGRTWEYVKTWGSSRGKTVRKSIKCISVPGSDHFFFVGTVSEGPHPEVEVSGSGLNAVVTVGDRTVRFDGERIVLGRK